MGDPRSPLPFYFRGKAKYAKGLYVEAVHELRSAIKLDPRHEKAKTLLKQALDHDDSLKNWKTPLLKDLTPRRKGQDRFLPLIDDTRELVAPTVSRSMSEGRIRKR